MPQLKSIRSLLLLGSCLLLLGSDCDPQLLEFVCANDPLNPQCRQENVVFVTSTEHDGNLGGTAGGDAICNDLAANSPIRSVAGGTYVAWLEGDGVDPNTRLTDPSGGFVRTDGRLVALSLADLIDGDLLNPIEFDENGDFRSGIVWTGTDPGGAGGGPTCNLWTSNSGGSMGKVGLSTSTSGSWSDFGDVACDTVRRLYCFEI